MYIVWTFLLSKKKVSGRTMRFSFSFICIVNECSGMLLCYLLCCWCSCCSISAFTAQLITFFLHFKNGNWHKALLLQLATRKKQINKLCTHNIVHLIKNFLRKKRWRWWWRGEECIQVKENEIKTCFEPESRGRLMSKYLRILRTRP